MTRLHHLIRRATAAACADRTDGELLARFRTAGDEDAFAEVVRRHGPLVYGACRRALAPEDAADAFQATFLVLVRRAGSLSRSPTVGPWLYRTAVLTARNVRRRAGLRRTCGLPDSLAATRQCPDAALDLDAALAELPDKYRTPVVLCHLQGWSRKEAAAHLGCPEGTLSSLLSRALAKLRRRLGGEGELDGLTAVVVPAGLGGQTARLAVAYAATRCSVVALPPTVALVVQGGSLMKSSKIVLAGILASVVFAFGAGAGEHPIPSGEGVKAEQPASPSVQNPQPPADRPEPPTREQVAKWREQLEREKAALNGEYRKFAEEQENYRRTIKDRSDRLEETAGSLREKEARINTIEAKFNLVSPPYIEVRVTPHNIFPMYPGDIIVTEVEGGQDVASVNAKGAGLVRHLKRLRREGAAGRLVIRVLHGVELSIVREAIEACREAGFERAEYPGPIEQTGADGKKVEVVRYTKEAQELSELLKGMPRPAKP